MSGFEFHSTRSIVVQTRASESLAEKVLAFNVSRVLVVTDPGVLNAGLLTLPLKGLEQAGLSVEVFKDVEADPAVSVIDAAVEQAIASRAECVIGFGGGSAMDVAKLAALLAHGTEKLADVYGVGMAKGPRLPLILVPTTAGTGSEVTPISIVTTGIGEKKGVVSSVLLPDVALLDASLTLKLPSHVTAATGVDAMVHAIEAYTSKRLKNPMSDCLAREALRLLAGSIHKATEDGSDVVARENMLLGACLAGMAFANAPVGGVHALAYPIGARFHVPHGLSNSLVLPAVARFNLDSCFELYAELADIVLPNAQGDAKQRALLFIDYLADLPKELGLPVHLTDVGISATDLAVLAEDAMLQTRLLMNNPREISLQDAEAIYGEVL